MSPVDIEAIREQHVPEPIWEDADDLECKWCCGGEWPCQVIAACDDLESARAALAAMTEALADIVRAWDEGERYDDEHQYEAFNRVGHRIEKYRALGLTHGD